ncbi:ATPase [Candidatus Cerribacteria bacterium 'Amazon FNV 2010 28 9']|uniref:ATPase n=1 Tax=Candidatus Cerribacteria bacterium 'Amazon FNV 2010 28 9' TaxID=2081795 RepID=A0A317JQ69_9BACT|nr:MAG: ATPase [Candidatus Cerribacteria bacterium 'Amazon FNV 2010 28 9']
MYTTCMSNLTASSSLQIDAPPEKVWKALTNPALVKQWLFGTEMKTDWNVGSSITYSGVWDGKPYEDKGKVLAIIPNKLIETSYWSVAYGLPDEPQNYKKVVYSLEEKDGGTLLTITQDNNATEDDKEHSQQNWSTVLEALKKTVETQP